MGRMLEKSFSGAGVRVLVLDRPLPTGDLESLFASMDLVMLAIPITVFNQVVDAVVPSLRPGTILTDICSVKVLPMMKMQDAYSGPVMGTHPLFGPEPGPGEELKVALCPGTGCDEARTTMVAKLFSRSGMQAFETTADEHDQAMACIQGLNFVTTVSYFASLPRNLNLDKFATPSFNRRVESARKMLNEDGPLFSSLAEDNPYTGKMIRRFKSFLNLSAAGELELLQDKALWWWRSEGERGGP